MVRSRWIKGLVLALASAGLVRGQTPESPYASSSGPAKAAAVVPAVTTAPVAPPPQPTPAEPPKLMPMPADPATASTDVYITVQEAGKPGQRCKVLKTWKMEDGSIASQVKSEETGEVMTIVEDGTGPVRPTEKVRDIASRVFHWGHGTPSADVPMPPGETMIVVDEKPTVGERVKGAFSRVFHKPGGAVGMEGEIIQPPVVVDAAPPPRSWPPAHSPKPFDKPVGKPDFGTVTAYKGQSTPTEKPTTKPVVVSNPPPAIPLPDYLKAKPSDWRSSWGKPEMTQTASVKKETPKVAVKPPEPPRPVTTAKVDLPQVDKKKPDPLKSLTEYNPKTMTDVTLNKPTVAPKAETPTASKEGAGGVPLGAQSVLQSGTTNYVPVPIVTLPGMNQPVGPTGRPPQPPQLNAKLNAFTNAPAPPATVDTPSDMANAFTPPQQQQHLPNPETVAANGAFGQGQAVPPAAMPNLPAYYQRAMMARGMVPTPGGYQQAMYPYGAPMVGYGPQQAGYAHVANPGYQVAMANPPVAAERMAPPSQTSVPQLAGVLRESMYPSQREWAAMKLADYNGHTQPAAVEALTRAAREDPAAIVRAASVRSLARMGVATSQVTATLQACRADADPRVQQEATLALSGTPSAQPIQQTGRKTE